MDVRENPKRSARHSSCSYQFKFINPPLTLTLTLAKTGILPGIPRGGGAGRWKKIGDVTHTPFGSWLGIVEAHHVFSRHRNFDLGVRC
ncbi:hypothetical protein CDAR_80501 [Caerostris darwini]|uniref:Uncharacterized protein n=1 Tax=Caerostris darwini TaxID=1538125 RepID=A0AAV4X2B2_9ARAC|nr:hypothetical protein CDAR_80501 [Caerostris darwini]